MRRTALSLPYSSQTKCSCGRSQTKCSCGRKVATLPRFARTRTVVHVHTNHRDVVRTCCDGIVRETDSDPTHRSGNEGASGEISTLSTCFTEPWTRPAQLVLCAH